MLASATPTWGQPTAGSSGSDTAWFARLSAAFQRRDLDDAILSLTMVARTERTKLPALDQGFVLSVVLMANQPSRRDAGFDLLQALFDAGWKLRYVGEPSELWRDLTAMLLERGDLERARLVARRIGSPRVLIGMRADRRFDAIVQAEPARFDVNAAAAAEVEALRAMVETWTDSMEPALLLSQALLTGNRCAEALEVVDAVRAYAASLEAEEKPYTDGGRFFVWILDQRARALSCLGRWDDALSQRIRTSVLTERGDPNVSHVINLANAYVAHGKPAEAIAALGNVGTMSGYGKMQMQAIRLDAAAQLNDERAIGEALAYLREHQDDAIATFQDTLLVVGEMDEAAAVLIRRLETPELRLEALLDLQHYADSPAPPVVLPGAGRFETLRRRPDVVAAIERVGRVETYESIRQ